MELLRPISDVGTATALFVSINGRSTMVRRIMSNIARGKTPSTAREDITSRVFIAFRQNQCTDAPRLRTSTAAKAPSERSERAGAQAALMVGASFRISSAQSVRQQ